MKKPVKNFREWSRSRSSFNLNESVQFPTNHNKIEQILEKLEIKNYSIKPDGTVDVNGDVNLAFKKFEYFPIKFGIITGDFLCRNCYDLKTLEGAPEKCKEFDCSDCYDLESLKGAPKECEVFNCSGCNIKTLKGIENGKYNSINLKYCTKLKTLEEAPKECNYFDCTECVNLKSLKGVLKKYEYFNCTKCINLKTLEHAPKECRKFVCDGCHELESLEHAPNLNVESFYACNCKKLKCLKGAPEKCKTFWCYACPSLVSLKGSPKECVSLNYENCKNLEYSIKHFSKCKEINLMRTPFHYIDQNFRNDFKKLINMNTDEEKDEFLLDLVKQKKLKLDSILDLLLSDKYKHKYRGIKAGERYVF